MMNIFRILFLLILCYFTSFAQPKKDSEFGTIFKYQLNNTSFPHNLRKEGYNYNSNYFSAEDHYNDSTVLLFKPKNFIPKDSIDIVFYFHGWWNNIDTSLVQFNLLEQFYKSKKNAFLVLSEAAKNTPDSFGGKLEERNIFKHLVGEIIYNLGKHYEKNLSIGKISLVGHSGAYRVMSYILHNGGLTENIKNVFLFDALYGNVDYFTDWINNFNGKFINIFTPNGGTKTNSEDLILMLNSMKIPNNLIDHDNFTSNDLMENRVIFIKSELGHSEVISTENQFQKFLESSY